MLRLERQKKSIKNDSISLYYLVIFGMWERFDNFISGQINLLLKIHEIKYLLHSEVWLCSVALVPFPGGPLWFVSLKRV